MDQRIIGTRSVGDLHSDKMNEMRRLRDFLDLKVGDDILEKIIDKFQPGTGGNKPDYFTVGGGKLFNKGVIGRFRQEMSLEDQAFCNRKLGFCIRAMGYEPY